MMRKIIYIPVFNYFDSYKSYNGEEIEPLNKYIIKIKSDNNITNLLFKNNICRVYGLLLKYLPNDVIYDIIYFIKASVIKEVNYSILINDLYNKIIIDKNDEKNDKHLKKNVINIITGLLEKNSNIKTQSLIFKNLQDAVNYKNKINLKNVKITI